jgi:predicted metal-dependent enzyme (double-stranded beta helix superfamily)
MTMVTPADPLAVAERAELTDWARSLAARPQEWLSQVRLSAEGRWYERIHRDESHEVWLISWLPGQATGFHDHGGSAGAFAVALGSLEEHDIAGDRTVSAGQVRGFGPRYVHDVRNVASAPAVSVHVYSPPLTVMNRYERTASGFVRLAQEDATEW